MPGKTQFEKTWSIIKMTKQKNTKLKMSSTSQTFHFGRSDQNESKLAILEKIEIH